MRIYFKIAILLLVISVGSSGRAQHKEETPTHGTINVLLANANGMVLVTDSRTTNKQFRLVSDKSPKLFQIDDKTVCSIAGFYFDRGPDFELNLQTPGMIAAVSLKLLNASKQGIALTFEEKARAIAERLSLFLRAHDIEIQNSSEPHETPGAQLFLLMAGYDLDGSAKITKIEISYQGRVEPYTIETVSNRFLSLTAGVFDGDGAQDRLAFPERFASEEPLKDYIDAHNNQRTGQLSLKQIDNLADYLESDVQKRWHQVVGGPEQKAVLSNGHVEMHPLLAPDPIEAPFIGGIVSEVHGSGNVVLSVRGPIVYVDNKLHDCVMFLDLAVFLKGQYDSCDFLYDGVPFYRDHNVTIRSGKLVVCPNIDGDLVKEAHKELPELTPVAYDDWPQSPSVAYIKRIFMPCGTPNQLRRGPRLGPPPS